MLFFYSGCQFRSAEYSYAPSPEYPDRTDQLSYVPVSRTVENFIASGHAVSSLREVTASLSESNNKDIKVAMDTEITAFDRNPYGIDLAEASVEIRRLNSLAEKKESDAKLAQKVEEARKASKGSGETDASGVPGFKSDS